MPEIKELIQFAIKKEKEAYKLYFGFAKKTENPAAKKLLEELAEEELGHKKILQNLSETESILNFQIKPVQDLKLSDHLVGHTIDENSDMQAVLIYAMKAEKVAFELYTKMAEAALDDQNISLFQKLAQMELSHKNRLETLYEDTFYTDN